MARADSHDNKRHSGRSDEEEKCCTGRLALACFRRGSDYIDETPE